MVKGCIIIFIIVLLTIQPSVSNPAEVVPQIQRVIQQGKSNLWSQIQKDEPIWNMLPTLGSMFVSEYYFELKALNISGDLQLKSSFNINTFKELLLSTQQQDGSWNLVKDLNRVQGSLDATIFNYWFLKDIGIDQYTEPMKKARKFVLDNGGIQNSQVMTRFKLAIFGQYQWDHLSYIPLFLFKKTDLLGYLYIKDYVAQWVYPHLIPLAYFRYHKVVFPVSVCLSQLRVSRSNYCEQTTKHNKASKQQNITIHQIEPDIDNMLEEAIKLKGPKGLYGGYTVSTMLIQIMFKDYSIRYGSQTDFAYYYHKNHLDTLKMVESIEITSKSAYQGSLVDGRYWDTILACYSLLESGQQPSKIHKSIEYLVTKVVQFNGGIPYGLQFQYAPDIDDTSILLLIYGKMKKYYKQKGNKQLQHFYDVEITRSYKWLKSNQNEDGGFPAFDKNKNDDQYNTLEILFWATGIDKSAQIFDPSCADITGHFLQGIGQCMLTETDQQLQIINKAISYLQSTKKERMWIGRWGINYIYAVGAVVPGLARIGYNLNQQWLKDVIRKLQQVQQENGGFGEDSQSYNRNIFLNGVSTASMTAWGLLAYLQMAEFMDLQKNIERAIYYLLKNFSENNNKFYDRSVVGTGHRGLLNLRYPIYAYTFPLIALSRAKLYLKKQRKLLINQNLNHEFKKYNLTIYGQL